jgi:hypothetical protein
VVAAVLHGDWKAGAEMGNAGDYPSLGKPVTPMQKELDGKVVVIAGDKVMLDIKG